MIKLKMIPIKGWRTFWRWWSTWLVAIGSSITTFSPEISEVLIHVWSIIPLDIKVTFRPEVVQYIGYAIAILAIPAKLVRQRKPHAIAERSKSTDETLHAERGDEIRNGR